jgi:hypothetical protein
MSNQGAALQPALKIQGCLLRMNKKEEEAIQKKKKKEEKEKEIQQSDMRKEKCSSSVL